MKNNLKTNSGWIVATFSLLTLFLVSVSTPAALDSNNISAKQEINTENVSSDPFIGEVIMFAGTFAPRGWAFCDGQILAINQHQALFSLLGTTYGGDGRTSFALPDLRGRVAIHKGDGPGLSSYRLGQKGGTETVSFAKKPMSPGKNRSINIVNAESRTSNMQPFTTINYIIALQGTFPSRS